MSDAGVQLSTAASPQKARSRAFLQRASKETVAMPRIVMISDALT